MAFGVGLISMYGFVKVIMKWLLLDVSAGSKGCCSEWQCSPGTWTEEPEGNGKCK